MWVYILIFVFNGSFGDHDYLRTYWTDLHKIFVVGRYRPMGGDAQSIWHSIKLVTIATPLERPQNEFQIDHPTPIGLCLPTTKIERQIALTSKLKTMG